MITPATHEELIHRLLSGKMGKQYVGKHVVVIGGKAEKSHTVQVASTCHDKGKRSLRLSNTAKIKYGNNKNCLIQRKAN